jgi:hypothetical protein
MTRTESTRFGWFSFLVLGILVVLNGSPKDAQAREATKVEGRVIAGDGSPVRQYPVVIKEVGKPNGRRFIAVTNTRGTYQISLPPGQYEVSPVFQPPDARIPIEVKNQTTLQVPPSTLRPSPEEGER